jgi:hypothetical protein
MTGVFRDKALEEAFQREGFVKVSFLDEAGLQKFRHHVQIIYKQFASSSYGICSATDLNQPALVEAVHSFVGQHILEYVTPYFEDFKVILGNYLIKKAQENTLIPIHQDWTFVDEKQFYSLSVWCPLDDVNAENGNLQVVPRSHRMSDNLRPSPSYPNAFEDVMDLARQHLTDIPMKAGEAIFYDHALLHASPVNHSARERSALILGLTHRDANLVHYYMDKWPANHHTPAVMEKYPMTEDFFVKHVRGSRPVGIAPIAKMETRLSKVGKGVFLRAIETGCHV